MDYIDEQNTFNADTGESGVLFNDSSISMMQNVLRSRVGNPVPGLEGEFNQLYSIGIRTGSDGKLKIADSSKLENALNNNLDDVIKLFGNSGESSSNYIEYFKSTSDSKTGTEFQVDISQAATQGIYQGTQIDNPTVTPITLDNSNNRIKFEVNGRESGTMILTERTYSTSKQLVDEIQSKIDADSLLAGSNFTVEWVGSGTTGYLKFSSSTYGSGSTVKLGSTVESSAFTTLGLTGGTETTGLDVAGTINGEQATGSGQFLTGDSGNATTDGVKLKVTFSEDQVISGAEGTITISQGVATRVEDVIMSLTKSKDGTFDRMVSSYQKQIELIQDRVADIDARLAIRRDTLIMQFFEMETALGRFDAEKQFLDSQLDSLNNNWNFAKK